MTINLRNRKFNLKKVKNTERIVKLKLKNKMTEKISKRYGKRPIHCVFKPTNKIPFKMTICAIYRRQERRMKEEFNISY